MDFIVCRPPTFHMCACAELFTIHKIKLLAIRPFLLFASRRNVPARDATALAHKGFVYVLPQP